MFCEYCECALKETDAVCPACGAKTGGATAVNDSGGRVGYSEVVNTPEFRQLASEVKRKDTNKSIRMLAFICVFAALYVKVAVDYSHRHSLLTWEPLLTTAVLAGVAFFIVFSNLKRIASNNRPPVEMIAEKYEKGSGSYEGALEGGGYQTFNVVFKDAKGRSISIGAADKRVPEYYRIGDRCLYYSDIKFFEKYDKSRDTFSLCPFCTMKVELGRTRCTHCDKPLLVTEAGAGYPARGAETGGAPRSDPGSTSPESTPGQADETEGSVVRASWTAWVPPIRNMHALKEIVIVAVIVTLGFGLVFVIATGEITALWLSGMMGAIFTLMLLAAKLFNWMIKGWKELFIVTDRGVWSGPAKSASKMLRGAFNAASVAHLLSGNPSAAGKSLMGRVLEDLAWRDVKQVIYKPNSRKIIIRGEHRTNNIRISMFCTKENYVQIAAMVRSYTKM